MAYLSRQIDAEKLKDLDFAILKKENEALDDIIAEKEHVIAGLHEDINKPNMSVGV